MEKMTRKQYFMVLKAMVAESTSEDKEGLTSFLDREMEKLEKRSTSPKQSEAAEKKEALKTALVEALSEAEAPMMVSELMALEQFSEYSNQKLTSMLRQLNLENRVVRTEVKKKAFYSVEA